MFCMSPDSKSEWKKWATGQSCIRKRSTTCRIGTLATIIAPSKKYIHQLRQILWSGYADSIGAWDLAPNLFFRELSIKMDVHTGKSLSEALIFASTNLQYDNRLFVERRASDKDLPVQCK